MENVQCTDQWISKEWIVEKYYSYKTILFRIAFSYLGNKHDCEDILQEAFIKLCFHAPNFPSDEDEKRWLIRITINLCKNQMKSYWNRNITNIEELRESVTGPVDSEILYEILRLPEKYKRIIQLYYFAGYKIAEISDFLKISESAVKMRLKRGRGLLKIEMEDYE